MQNVAQSLKDLGRREEAVREYRHTVAVKPRFGLAWLGLGQMLEENGDKAGAEKCYEKAMQNRIHRPAELTTLAHFCEARGWREAAATNYDEALKLNPLAVQVYLEAGRNLSALGRHEGAEQDFREATKLAPNSVEGHFLDGLELGSEGKPAAAAGQFRETVRIMPNLPEARFNLGLSLMNAGKYAEALEQFETLLQQNPGNDQALRYAQALRQKLDASQPH
jgi:tetratricopeptide (TPR) repeat protein